MRHLLTTGLLIIAFATQAQLADKIIRTNTDTVNCSIIYVNNTSVKYRVSKDRSVQPQTLRRYQIAKIIYADGREQVFNVTRPQDIFFRNRFEWVFTDLFLASGSFAYERLNKNLTIGVRIPISISPFRQMGGVDLRFYPTGANGMFKYFFGPQMRFGNIGVSGTMFNIGPNAGFSNYPAFFSTVTFANGVTYNSPNGLNIGIYGGLGVRMVWFRDGGDFLYFNQPFYEDFPLSDQIAPQLRFGITMGKNF